MMFLFNSRLSPLTNHIGFFNANIDEVMNGFIAWYERGNKIVDDKVGFSSRLIKCDFNELLEAVLPFSRNATSKMIVFETKERWCAYIDNDWTGSNLNFIDQVSKMIGIDCVLIRAWEQNFGKQPNTNGWGGGDFIYSNPATGQYRSVGLRYELTKWEFDQYGEPLPFEELEVYKTKPIKNRLTPEMIDRYAKQFGLDFFNEDFYMPPGSKAYLIETSSKYLDTVETLTLEENRKRLGLE